MREKEVVLITGSSGFIGSALARRLVKDYQVIGIDGHEPREKIPGVDYYTLDLTANEDVYKTLYQIKEFSGGHLSSVIHLVAYYNFDGKESDKYQSITVKCFLVS